ncbi:hypothetical protein [Paraburkholderia sp. GAS42]|jgi:hypothetical protein|uniref:hypothetical protein n=1 Tax=Paraburkholderia sp. GAS42 TaxID=3035135 RepID=UPI003D1C7335
MRPVFRIDMKLTTLGAAVCVSLASMTLPLDVIAQVVAPASDSSTTPVASVAPLSPTEIAVNPSSAAADAPADGGAVTAQALTIPADTPDVAASNDLMLDDQMLSRQRGGAVGMVMVAATPQMRGGSVTLWDEIAPPTPLPVPVDAARAAQSNVASYTRK